MDRVLSRLVQKFNHETERREYALVSKKDSSKILKWFGPKKPSQESVEKEERRVQYFKHAHGFIDYDPRAGVFPGISYADEVVDTYPDWLGGQGAQAALAAAYPTVAEILAKEEPTLKLGDVLQDSEGLHWLVLAPRFGRVDLYCLEDNSQLRGQPIKGLLQDFKKLETPPEEITQKVERLLENVF